MSRDALRRTFGGARCAARRSRSCSGRRSRGRRDPRRSARASARSASAASVPGSSAMCSWHFSAVRLRYGSIAISSRAAALRLLHAAPEVQVRRDGLLPQMRISRLFSNCSTSVPDRRRRSSRPSRPCRRSRRSSGRAATRRADGRSGGPSSRTATGPSCPRSCTARSPADPSGEAAIAPKRSAIVSSASSHEMRSKRPSPLLPTRCIGCSTRSVEYVRSR